MNSKGKKIIDFKKTGQVHFIFNGDIDKLKSFFNKSNEEATKIMLHVHQNGIGVCGVFSYEIAETKVIQVLDTSRKNNHPLQCTMEKA